MLDLRYFFQNDVDVTSMTHFDVLKSISVSESNRKTMNRNWSNQKANPALKTKAGNK